METTAAQKQLAQMEILGVGLRGPRVYVDRRGFSRIVPMKLLCLGLPRTGTSTLRIALMQLGFADVYHMFELWEENPKDDDLWVEAFEAKYEGKGKKWGRKEWDALTGHCMAVTDMPSICFADDLIDVYPEAKVILTVRDNEEVWYESIKNTIWSGNYLLSSPKSTLQALVQLIGPRPEAWRTVQYCYKYSVLDDFPDCGKQNYLAYNTKIKNSVPKGRILTFNVKQGWGPLCEFLGVPVPDLPFPKVNDTRAWRDYLVAEQMKLIMKAVKIMTALGVVGVGLYIGRRGFRQ